MSDVVLRWKPTRRREQSNFGHRLATATKLFPAFFIRWREWFIVGHRVPSMVNSLRRWTWPGYDENQH